MRYASSYPSNQVFIRVHQCSSVAKSSFLESEGQGHTPYSSFPSRTIVDDNAQIAHKAACVDSRQFMQPRYGQHLQIRGPAFRLSRVKDEIGR